MDKHQIAHVSFPAEMGSLTAILNWVRCHLAQAELSPREKSRVELSLEEALTNVIRYAYPQGHGEVEISCSLYPSSSISFTVVDRGIPFDPLNYPIEEHQWTPLEQRREGGVGILLMRHYMDEIHYERRGDFNVLILTKQIGQSSSR